MKHVRRFGMWVLLLGGACPLRKCHETAACEPIAHAHVGWSHLMAIKHFSGSLSCYIIISTVLLNHMWSWNDSFSCKKQLNWISWETLNTNFPFQCLPWWRWMYLRFIRSETLSATESNSTESTFHTFETNPPQVWCESAQRRCVTVLLHDGGSACPNDSYEHQLQRLLLHWGSWLKPRWIYCATCSFNGSWGQRNRRIFSFENAALLWFNKKPHHWCIWV